MEYNEKTMLFGDGASFRECTSQNYLQPCTTLESSARLACFYSLPAWWFQSATSSTETFFTEAGSYCQELIDPGSQRMCFQGVGLMAAEGTYYNAEEAIALCQLAAPESNQLTYCLAEAARRLGSYETGRGAAHKPCEILSGKKQLYCTLHEKRYFSAQMDMPLLEDFVPTEEMSTF